VQRDLRRPPDHGELTFSSDLLVCEMSVEIVNALDRRAVHSRDDVAFEYTRFSAGLSFSTDKTSTPLAVAKLRWRESARRIGTFTAGCFVKGEETFPNPA
jgi:hypothetical protein